MRKPSFAAALAVLLATCGCGQILGLEKKLPPGDGEDDGDLQDRLDLPDAEDPDGGEEIPTCTTDGECDDGDVCNGIETCDTGTRTCREGEDQPDGTLCIPLPRHICMDGQCVESVCGDCFLDRGNGEFCDDCNENPDDGCDACRLSCEEDEDCADGDVCNGDEVCNPVSGFCETVEGLDDGETCGTDPRRICISGVCSVSLCGDGFLDTGGGEMCDGDPPRDCTPSCGGTGSQACEACDWGPCRGPDESCNGLDDDCDGQCDNGFECCAGALDAACLTCGLTDGIQGQRTCQDACEWTACCSELDVCNGCDDDCDGDTDPPVKRGADFWISAAGLNYSSSPAVAWNAVRGEFGVAWHDGRHGGASNGEIYFAVVLPSGAIRVAERRITNASGLSLRPSLVHDGSGYGLVWEDNRTTWIYHIRFVRLDDDGAPTGTETVVDASTSHAGQASLAVTGTGFAVAWEDERGGAGQDDIYSAALDAAGVKVGSDVMVASATGESRNPSLVRAGSRLAVAWQDNRDGNNEIYFQELNLDGTPLGSAVRVTSDPEDSVGVSLAWSGSEYGLAWFTLRDGGSVYFARLDGSGVRIGSDVSVSPASDVSSHNYVENGAALVWEAGLSAYGVAWILQGAPGNDLAVFFARLAPDGVMIGTDLPVSASSDDKVQPALAFGSATWLVAWRDYHGSSSDGDLLAATLGCLPPTP